METEDLHDVVHNNSSVVVRRVPEGIEMSTSWLAIAFPNPRARAAHQSRAIHTRDSVTGLDHAVNRYYSGQWGRCLSLHPYVNSAGLEDPAAGIAIPTLATIQSTV